ncbi:protein of unknown function [bacterium A37T11]|nr:protein of unknown function [bacterium A37T11]
MKVFSRVIFTLLLVGQGIYLFGQDSFEITGTTGVTCNKVYLRYHDALYDKHTDSASVLDGRFSFSGQIAEPYYATLDIRNAAGRQVVYQGFFLCPGETKINVVDSSGIATIEGGPEQKVFHDFESGVSNLKNVFHEEK